MSKQSQARKRKNNMQRYLCSYKYDLLIKLVSLVFMNNPDVLFGWEIEKNSWGYIVQRCNALGIPIIPLSRYPLSRIKFQTAVMI